MTDNKPWWKTIPAILGGLATLITAVTGLIIALNQNQLPENTTPCNLPDLQISELSFKNGEVSVAIKNIGNSTANISDNIVLQGYWSKDGKEKDVGAGGWRLKNLIQGGLSPGQSVDHSWTPSNPINKPYLMMIVDSNYSTDECSEGNNTKVIKI